MISVIIPLYNKQDSIAETLRSVFAQTYSDFELVVVDDGSTDNSVPVVENYISTNVFCGKSCYLLKQKNAGPSAARNRGIERARGEYVAFLDADDIWLPTYLEEQAYMIRDFPTAAMWSTAFQCIKNGNLWPRISQVESGFRGYLVGYFKRHLKLFCTCSIVIKKDVFDTVGAFDIREMDGEDLDLWYRIVLHFPVAHTEQVLVHYKQDAENRITNTLPTLEKHFVYYVEKFEQARSEREDFRKYYDREVLGHLFKYFLRSPNDPNIQRILRQMDFSILPFSYRLRYKLPKVYFLLKKIRKLGCQKVVSDYGG